MIAYSVDTVGQIRQFFDDRRYVCAVYDDRAGRLRVRETQEPKNLFFLPPHQAERLLRAARWPRAVAGVMQQPARCRPDRAK